MDAGDVFDSRAARRDLRRYRRRGPSGTTRLLLDGILAQRNGDQSLLDIGGGVGAIPHELMRAGFSHALQIDASAAYLAASEEEAGRLGHRERIAYERGDFVALASNVAPADVVTLDRVVCCYPDMVALVTASAGKAQHLYGLVLPRERLLTRVVIFMSNLLFRVRRSAFRTFLHSPPQVEQVVRQAGFRRSYTAQTLLWSVVTYARVDGAPPERFP